MSTTTVVPEFASLREKIAWEKQERADRYARFETLVAEAHEAGHAAATATVPPVMVVGSPSTPLGSDIDPSQPIYVETEGPCGFAWIKIGPATSSFGRWLIKTARGRTSYPKGVMIWVSGYGQSLARKEAYARAYAAVLEASPDLANVRVYAGSRMD